LPTAMTVPLMGFSVAESGITMPPGEVRSSSRRLMITRSCNGRIFSLSAIDRTSPMSRCELFGSGKSKRFRADAERRLEVRGGVSTQPDRLLIIGDAHVNSSVTGSSHPHDRRPRDISAVL